MGKGDKKTRRGKIVRGSFGVRRRRKGKTIAQIIRQKEKEAPAEKLVEAIETEKIDKAEEKPAPKKPAAKKTTVKKAETEKKAEKKPAKKPAAKSVKKSAEKKE